MIISDRIGAFRGQMLDMLWQMPQTFGKKKFWF